MLVLTRKEGGKIRVDHNGERLEVTVERVDGNRVRIGFSGPRSFQVARGELEEDTRVPDRASEEAQPAVH